MLPPCLRPCLRACSNPPLPTPSPSTQTALAAVFVEGFIFIALALLGVRSKLIELIPRSIMLATSAGIGLFLAFIGLQVGAGCGVCKAWRVLIGLRPALRLGRHRPLPGIHRPAGVEGGVWGLQSAVCVCSCYPVWPTSAPSWHSSASAKAGLRTLAPLTAAARSVQIHVRAPFSKTQCLHCSTEFCLSLLSGQPTLPRLGFCQNLAVEPSRPGAQPTWSCCPASSLCYAFLRGSTACKPQRHMQGPGTTNKLQI